MQFLLDNLVATIIAATMALVLLSTRHSQIEQGVERVRHYAARQNEMNFVETLRFDMHNVLAVEHVQMTSDSSFTFQSVKDASNLTEKVLITYRLRRTGTVGGQPVFAIDRTTVSGAGAAGTIATPGILPGAGATQTVTERILTGVRHWTIRAKAEEGSDATVITDAKAIYIRFGIVSPYLGIGNRAAMKAVPELTWEATYRPPFFRHRLL